ncbi:hypothetical protein [Paraburkholderia pallida]|uniref:STAS domain-containing protein n=1 Tax=Paraburkholderia pallida TaxID=2547399 RepID=A0A4P7DBE2_9BURK|nr:hypothetical protein [Paraburkholderia pallida]QBR04122.1 hypothetical protein E1956_44040 [Paraburkholderia pallida]
MLKIERFANGGILLGVIGDLRADNVNVLTSLLADEPADRVIALDLKSLVQVDTEAVRFLRRCEAQGIVLRNCPAYVRTWISSLEPR